MTIVGIIMGYNSCYEIFRYIQFKITGGHELIVYCWSETIQLTNKKSKNKKNKWHSLTDESYLDVSCVEWVEELKCLDTQIPDIRCKCNIFK